MAISDNALRPLLAIKSPTNLALALHRAGPDVTDQVLDFLRRRSASLHSEVSDLLASADQGYWSARSMAPMFGERAILARAAGR